MAITTSPDNIPSPTSGDPYNYVVDMAAMADRTQEIFTQKANMGVGTSTQRTAALSKFPDGALWYDTTTSSEWRRVAGAWVNQDAGWNAYTTTWGAQVTAPSLGNGILDARYTQRGKTVTFSIELTTGSTTTYGTGIYTFTLPVASRAIPITGIFRAAGMGMQSTRYPLLAYGISPTHFRMIRTDTLQEVNQSGLGAAWGSGDFLSVFGTYEIV